MKHVKPAIQGGTEVRQSRGADCLALCAMCKQAVAATGVAWSLGSELRKFSTSEIIVLLRITIVTLEPENKVRKTSKATRGNGWRPKGGSSLAERRARPSDGVTLPAGAQRRQDLRWSETTRMAPKTFCHDLEPRESPRAPRPTGSDPNPDVRTNT